MFKRLSTGQEITFYFNDATIIANAGDSVAAALLASGHSWFRESPVSGDQRGPWCMMGTCYECLVEKDNKSVQACMITVKPGLRIYRVKT